MPWELADMDDDDVLMWVEEPPEKPAGNRGMGGYQCACGRFAKFLGGRDYYNGSFSCYSYNVQCKRCGVVTVECV